MERNDIRCACGPAISDTSYTGESSSDERVGGGQGSKLGVIALGYGAMLVDIAELATAATTAGGIGGGGGRCCVGGSRSIITLRRDPFDESPELSAVIGYPGCGGPDGPPESPPEPTTGLILAISAKRFGNL